MKTKSFFLTMMAAVVFTACTKDENPGEKETGYSNLVVNIKGEKTAPASRTGGTTTAPTGESTINNLVIFVFKSNGDNDIAPQAYASSTTTANLHISTNAAEVCVVANTAGNTTVQNALTGVTKKSELQAIVGRGFTAVSSGTATQSATNLWMSGSASISPSANSNVTATVTLSFIPAKLRISAVTVDASVNIELSEVLVLNGGGATKLIPADKATSLIPSFTASANEPFYVSGVSMASWNSKPTIYDTNAAYKYELTGDKTIKTGINQHDFYVFENSGATGVFDALPTILTLKAKNKNDSDKDVYYSVLFKMNTSNEGYDEQIIERGKDYNVTMTIKKIGTADPTTPTPKTTVEVSITSASWQTVTMDKTYQ